MQLNHPNDRDSGPDAADIVKRFEQVAVQRGNWESHWQEAADYALPRQSDITFHRAAGEKRGEKIFDDTAKLAVSRFAAAVESYVAPRGQKWHRLRAQEDRLNERPEVRAYYDQVSRALFRHRYMPAANFAGNLNEALVSLAVFGTCALYIDSRPGQGLAYRAVPMAELYLEEDAHGNIDQVWRKYALTARQAAQAFDAKRLPQAIVDAIDREPSREFAFLHHVGPRLDREYGRADAKGMRFSSCYIALDAKEVVGTGGFRTFPYAIGRYEKAPREVYGRGPVMTALQAIKMVNAMSKTVIRGAELLTLPPLLLSSDGAMGRFNLSPAAQNFGTLDENGRPRVVPFNVGARPEVGGQFIEQHRKMINDSLLVSLFQILVDAPAMTATEALMRAQEKGQLIGPALARLTSEMFGPMIERELELLAIDQLLPPPPSILARLGARLDIEYVSPIMQNMRAGDAMAIQQFIGQTLPLIQYQPELAKRINFEKIAGIIAESIGVPQEVMFTPEELRKRQAEQSSQAQGQGQAMLGQLLSGLSGGGGVAAVPGGNPLEALATSVQGAGA